MMGKPWVRLYPIDISRMAWVPVDGSSSGAWEKRLAVDPLSGSLTRYLKLAPGSTVQFDRDRWQETYVIEGDYRFDGHTYREGSYLCIPPASGLHEAATRSGAICFQVLDRNDRLGKPDVRLDAAAIEAMKWDTASRGDPKHREKILARDTRGSLTRLLEIDPGGDTTELDDHDHNEEVLILKGSCKNGDEFHPAGTYTFNPPHAQHGPFIVDELLVCFEVKNQT